MKDSPRIALIGAGRRRQGLGPFVARDLTRAGLRVAAFCTSRAESVGEAAEALAREGITCPGFGGMEALLAAPLELDALAILSPPEHHERALAAALARSLHVLCEKPLLLAPGSAPRVSALAHSFHEQGLVLYENCQWPAVLPVARDLAGAAFKVPPHEFRMALAPEETGRRGILDALSHPLSLLRALLPGPLSLGRIEVADSPTRTSLTFDLSHAASMTLVQVLLQPSTRRPRPASFGWDAWNFERKIDSSTYAMVLAEGQNAKALPDPLTRHLANFAATLRATLSGSAPPSNESLVERARLLDALVEACPRP